MSRSEIAERPADVPSAAAARPSASAVDEDPENAIDEATGMPLWAREQLRTFAFLHPEAAALEEAAPGPSTVEYLHSLVPSEMTDLGLSEGIAAWERVSSWAAARQAQLALELVRRSTASMTDEFLADEIATRLSVTGRVAHDLLERAVVLDRVPALADALGSGKIDVRRTDVLVRGSRHLGIDDARKVIEAVLPAAEEMTAPRLRTEARRVEVQLAPEAVAERHTVARRERHVRVHQAPDAMAFVTAYLPATDASVLMTALDAMADRAEPDDDRCADERRADALTGLARRVLDSGVGLDGPLSVRQHRRPHLSITVSAETVRRGWDGVAELAGYGPVPAQLVQDLAEQAEWRIVLTDESTGEVVGRSRRSFRPASRPDGRRGPAGPRPTEPPELDHLPSPRRSSPGSSPPTGGPSTPDESPRAHAEPEASVARGDAGGGGCAGAPGSDSYRPPAWMTHLVVERDVTCTFPGCRVPSARCDLDHVVPFDPERPAEEQTHPDNLQALCRHHHRLKTLGRWKVRRDAATGITTWVSPNGRVALRRPWNADPGEPPF